MTKILVPPIKCQGIKTKLVPTILVLAEQMASESTKAAESPARWIEPFMGSCVVGLNTHRSDVLVADVNPHLVRFYQALQSREIEPHIVKQFLIGEGKKLQEKGEEHYYNIRKRFNATGSPLDFLFLSRSCFNGLIRFNRKQEFNVPFCRKPERFAKPYITKIVNQVAQFQKVLTNHRWQFYCQDFAATIESAREGDLIYCDPPYLGRHVDYFDSWSLEDEHRLYAALSKTRAKFILSTWHSNQYRENETLKTIWRQYPIRTREHFYHLGGKESNRNAMVEALVMNFQPPPERKQQTPHHASSFLF